MFAHAAHNVFIQTIFNPLMVDTGPTEYIIGEFGVSMAMAYAAAAFVFWRMRDRLPEAAGLKGRFGGADRQGASLRGTVEA
jgi:hypothetical protein